MTLSVSGVEEAVIMETLDLSKRSKVEYYQQNNKFISARTVLYGEVNLRKFTSKTSQHRFVRSTKAHIYGGMERENFLFS